MRTVSASTRARRPLVIALALLGLVASACSVGGGAGGSSPTTGGGPGPTVTPAPTEVDPTDFDPCDLVGRGDLEPLVEGRPMVQSRGLALGAPTTIDECRLDSVGPGIVSVGVAAADPTTLQDLLPPQSPLGEQKKARQLEDLGEEAFVQEIGGDFYVVVDAGEGRLLRVRAAISGLTDKSPEPVIALARLATDRLPRRLPDGGSALPPICRDLDPDLVTAVVGDVVLARGSEVADGFTCDLVGAEGDKAFVEAYRTETPTAPAILSNDETWRPISGGEEAAVSPSGQYFIATAAEGVEVVVDTGASDAPIDGAEKGGYPVDDQRRALFLAGVELARSLA